MNQEKIGKFIQNLRKEKKLSQIELAKRIGVTNKAVSKWETGNGMPDYGVFENLCKEFDITVNELLNGERNANENNILTEYMEYKAKQDSKKKRIFKLISILILLCFIFIIYFFNSYNKINVYKLSGNSKGFNYSGGVLVLSNISNVFDKGKLSVNDDIHNNIIILDRIFAIKENGKYYKLFSWEYDFLEVEKYGSDELFPSDKIKNIPKNMYLLVYYIKDGNSYLEEIPLTYKRILNNNKFLNLKSKKSDYATLYEEVSLDTIFNPIDYKKQLLNSGFGERNDNKDGLYVTMTDNCREDYCLYKMISEDEIIAIDYINKQFYYSYRDGKYGIDIPAYHYDDTNYGVFRFWIFYEENGKDEFCSARIHENGSITCACLKDEKLLNKYAARIKELIERYKYKDE